MHVTIIPTFDSVFDIKIKIYCNLYNAALRSRLYLINHVYYLFQSFLLIFHHEKHLLSNNKKL